MMIPRSSFYILALFSFVAAPTRSHAQQFKLLHSFGYGNDGASPDARLTSDSQGNLYGTTPDGGTPSANCPDGCGTVYELNAADNYAESVIHSFEGPDGALPFASNLTFGPDGSLYGVTNEGGNLTACKGGCGTVFRLTPSRGAWTEQVLHSFTRGADGAEPNGGVIFDNKGNLYGVTIAGPRGAGTVFKLSLSAQNNEIASYSLPTALEGAAGKLVADINGNVFGVAPDGGQYGRGAIFELTASTNGPTLQVIYSFCAQTGCPDGMNPNGNLAIRGSNLYGTAPYGGPNNAGVVFELAPIVSGWQETTIYGFSATGATDGAVPEDGPVFDQSGTLYGTTEAGGPVDNGTVFSITLNGANATEHVIHFFDGTDGATPYAAPLPYKGNLFGTTSKDGQYDSGTVYQIAP